MPYGSFQSAVFMYEPCRKHGCMVDCKYTSQEHESESLGRHLYKGSVIPSELSFIKGSAVTAYLYRACKKVIVDYSDENADFNQR